MDNSIPATPFQWDDEKIAIALRLKGEGLSASEIAGEMGTTKGSVLGKMRRLGLSVPKADTPNKGKLYVARKRKALAANGNPHLPSKVVDLLSLRPEDCRWPVTDRPPHLFCAEARWGGSPYCACHTARAWRSQGGAL